MRLRFDLVKRQALTQVRIDLHEEVTQLMQGHAFALLVLFGRGGAVGQAQGGAFEGAEHQVGIDDRFFLDRNHAGALDHSLEQGGAQVGGHVGNLTNIQVVPVHQAWLLAAQETPEQIATLALVWQAEVDFDREAAQHRLVHLGRGVVEVGRHDPDHVLALVALDAVEQAEQRIGGVVFPFLFAATTRREQGLCFIQENDAAAAGASLAVQGIERLGAAADIARLQRRTRCLDQRYVQFLGKIAHQFGLAGTRRARQHHVERLVDVVRLILAAVADHFFQVQHFLLDVVHADQVVHAALELLGHDHGGVHTHAGDAEFNRINNEADHENIQRMALQKRHCFRGDRVLSLVEQDRLVGGQVVVGRDRVRNGVLEQDFALQAQVRGAWHLDHVQLRSVAKFEDVAGRFRQRLGDQQIVELGLVGRQRGNAGNILRINDRARVLRRVGLVDGHTGEHCQHQYHGNAHVHVLEGDLEFGEVGHIDTLRSVVANERSSNNVGHRAALWPGTVSGVRTWTTARRQTMAPIDVAIRSCNDGRAGPK